MKQLNIGIIGAGRIGKVHMQSITYNVPTAKVLGITAVFKDGLQELADKYGIEKVYNDYKEMLADKDIDAVLVCSSTDTHADISIEAAQAGKRVFCEKPADLTPEKVQAVIDAVERRLVIEPNLYNTDTLSEDKAIEEKIRSKYCTKNQKAIECC